MVATLEILAYNRPGVLDRIAGLIRRQGWNIDALSTADTKNNLTRITLSLYGLSVDIDPLADCLSDMEGIASWQSLNTDNTIIRELLLLALPKEKQEFLQAHQMRPLEEDAGVLYAEFTGTPTEVIALQERAAKEGFQAIRKGTVILRKGEE